MCSGSEVREEMWAPIKDMSVPVVMGVKGRVWACRMAIPNSKDLESGWTSLMTEKILDERRS